MVYFSVLKYPLSLTQSINQCAADIWSRSGARQEPNDNIPMCWVDADSNC